MELHAMVILYTIKCIDISPVRYLEAKKNIRKQKKTFENGLIEALCVYISLSLFFSEEAVF